MDLTAPLHHGSTTRPAVRHPRGPLVGALTVLALALSGCGSSDEADPAAASSSSPSSSSSSSSESASTSSSSAVEVGATDDCMGAAGDIEAATSMLAGVTGVELKTCAVATVTTSLTTSPEDVEIAAGAICPNAANEAAGHDVAAVSVVAADGTEIAAGTNSMDCDPRP